MYNIKYIIQMKFRKEIDSMGSIKVDDNKYTFSASSGTATTGGLRGGGGRVTAGPVTLGT